MDLSSNSSRDGRRFSQGAVERSQGCRERDGPRIRLPQGSMPLDHSNSRFQAIKLMSIRSSSKPFISKLFSQPWKHSLPNRRFNVLAIESSADDTCAAVVSSSREILSNVVLKQYHMSVLPPFSSFVALILSFPKSRRLWWDTRSRSYSRTHAQYGSWP